MNIFLSLFLGASWMTIFILATWSGIRKFLWALSRDEKIATTVITSIVLTSWMGFVCWYMFGQHWGNFVLLMIAGGVIAFDWAWYRRMITRKKLISLQRLMRNHPRDLLIGTVLVSFLTLLVTRYALPIGSDGWYSSGPSWGDTPLHLSLGSYFVQHGVRDLVLPLFPSVRLAYPFLLDLHSAQLFTITQSWQASLGLDSWFLLASLAYLIYRVGWRLSRSSLASTIWTLVIFGSGSAAGINTFLQDLNQGFPTVARDYSNLAAADPTTQQFFANLTTSHLLPQRTYLAGCAIAFAVLVLLIASYKQTASKISPQQESRVAYFIAILVGLTPFIHVHSFLVLALILVLFCTVRFWSQKKLPVVWIRAGVVAICLSLPQVIWQFRSGYTSGFSHWQFGWLTAPDSSVLNFWVINLGLLIPIILWASWQHLQNTKKGDWIALFIAVGGFLFLICNLYVFQPNEWDNMKLLSYGYIFLTLPASVWLSSHWRKGLFQKLVAGLILVVIILPGSLSIYRQLTVTDRLFTSADIEVATFARNHLDQESIILTSSNHNNPIASLSGHKVVLGYPGWLGSYGIPYESVLKDATAIWTNTEVSSEALSRQKVDYIAFSDTEATQLNTTSSTLDDRFESIYDKDGWHIYRATQKPLDQRLPTP